MPGTTLHSSSAWSPNWLPPLSVQPIVFKTPLCHYSHTQSLIPPASPGPVSNITQVELPHQNLLIRSQHRKFCIAPSYDDQCHPDGKSYWDQTRVRVRSPVQVWSASEPEAEPHPRHQLPSLPGTFATSLIQNIFSHINKGIILIIQKLYSVKEQIS